MLDQYHRLEDKLTPAVRHALTKIAALIVEKIQEDISLAYPPQSSPGEPPRVRTGALRRSVRIGEVGDDYVKVAAGGPGTLVPYAGFLEFGTSRMEPRPFVIPAVNMILDDAAEIVREVLDTYLDDELGG